MSRSVAEASCAAVSVQASVSLSVVFNQQKSVLPADVFYISIIGASSVQVYKQHGFCAGRYGFFRFFGAKLQGGYVWLHKYGFQPVFCDGEYGGYVCVCRHYHFIAGVQDSCFNVGSEYKNQSVESICHADGVVCAYVLCIVLLKGLVFVSLQVSAGSDNTVHCLLYFIAMQGCYFLKVKKLYHSDILPLRI